MAPFRDHRGYLLSKEGAGSYGAPYICFGAWLEINSNFLPNYRHCSKMGQSKNSFYLVFFMRRIHQGAKLTHRIKKLSSDVNQHWHRQLSVIDEICCDLKLWVGQWFTFFRFSVIWCDVMCYDVMWCDLMWCNGLWDDVMWDDVMWDDVMWDDVLWDDVMWDDVMWCDVK